MYLASPECNNFTEPVAYILSDVTALFLIEAAKKKSAERTGLEITTYICIWWALLPNPGHDSGSSHCEICCCAQSQASAGILPQLGQEHFLPNHFQFISRPTM
jgi:hypothetical protein